MLSYLLIKLSWLRSQVTKAGCQMVIDFALPKIAFKIPQIHGGVDERQFHSRDFGKILHVLRRHAVTVTGVMSSPGVDPGRTGCFEIRPAFPNLTGYR